MEAEPLPRPSPDVVFQKMQDEVVLVHLATSEIYALNRTGARFWELLSGGGTRAAIESVLADEFEIDIDAIRREIDEIVRALKAHGLLA